ncbi:MAG: hypothetical protein D3924_13695 [Candidatus Electrothrix sp. AR4]|nr:hypothetical protein [Candidatus Electrothrix sp. AR4]
MEWGRFRSGGVTIAGTEYMPPSADYMPPSADELPELFAKMVKDRENIPDVYECRKIKRLPIVLNEQNRPQKLFWSCQVLGKIQEKRMK